MASTSKRGILTHKGLGIVAAALLLPWVGWTTAELPDPWRGLSLADLGLVGDVAMVVVEEATMFQGASGLVEGPRSLSELMSFGRDGLLRQWVQYSRLQGVAVIHEYTYVDGALAMENVANDSGRQIEQTAYTHEDAGKRTTAEVRSGRKTLQKTLVYERDGGGKLLTVTEYDAAGTLVSTLAYSRSGREERADRYDHDGNLLSWSIKTHDAKGQIIEVSLYSDAAEDSPYTTTYELNARGHVTLEETSGQLTLGFLTFSASAGPTKTSYEYTYDDTGNWTKRVKSVWISSTDSPHWQRTSVTYRTIRYYEE